MHQINLSLSPEPSIIYNYKCTNLQIYQQQMAMKQFLQEPFKTKITNCPYKLERKYLL